MGGSASSPASPSMAGGSSVRRTWTLSMLRGALAGLGLGATVLVPASLLLPDLRLPWGLMLGASLALPLVMAVYPALLDLDSAARHGTADGGGLNSAELPGSLSVALYVLIAVSALAIGAGAGALATTGAAGSSRVAAAMALAAVLGPGVAGAALVRRSARTATGRILRNAGLAVAIAVFLLAEQWAALWIVMFYSGWTR